MTDQTLEAALALYQRGDPKAALSISRLLAAEGLQDLNLVVFHSGLLLHLKKFDEAKDFLVQAEQHYPNEGSILANLSVSQRACGDIPESIESAERALAVAPNLLSAWNALLLGYIANRQQDIARTHLEKALEIHPDAPSLRHIESRLADESDGNQNTADQGVVNNLIAEGKRLLSKGLVGPSETALRQALSIDPNHPHARAVLGETLLMAGRPEEARPELALAVRHLPSNSKVRYLHEIASGKTPPVAPNQYVRDLFNGMAGSFDSHLQEKLNYKIPQEIAARLTSVLNRPFGEILDLGCGTGLVGLALADRAEAIDGVDLSARMLLEAKAKDCYRDLHMADIGEFLRESKRQWDIIAAADVFVYYGQIEEIFLDISRVLSDDGCFVFSVEDGHGESFDVDRASGRYQHSRTYLESSLTSAGLGDFEFSRTVIRQELGTPVVGWLVLARKQDESDRRDRGEI